MEIKDMPNSGICREGWEPPFIIDCCFCRKEVRLVKDSTEGQKVACFDCSHRFNQAGKN